MVTVNYLQRQNRQEDTNSRKTVASLLSTCGLVTAVLRKTVLLQHAMLVGPGPRESGTSRTRDLANPGLHGPGTSLTRILADPGPSGRILYFYLVIAETEPVKT